MIYVAIVDDDEKCRKELEAFIFRYGSETKEDIRVTCYANALDFTSEYASNFDIIFFDIDMPGLNGMEAAGEIRRTDDKVCIIFVTNMVQFAVKGYDVGAMSYMVKPIEYFAFSVQFKKAIAHTNLKNSQDYVYLHTKEFSKKIFLNDLYMIEVIDHSLTYHTKDGDYNGWGQISKAEDELISKHFFRCNKCYLVNLQHVHEVTGLTAKVGNKELLVSRRRKREFLQALNEYLGWSDD